MDRLAVDIRSASSAVNKVQQKTMQMVREAINAVKLSSYGLLKGVFRMMKTTEDCQEL